MSDLNHEESVSAFQAERRAFESRLPLQLSIGAEMIDLRAATTDELITLGKSNYAPALEELYRRARDKYASLENQSISVSDAATKYGTKTVYWRELASRGRIRILKQGAHGRGNVAELNAADVAVYWELHKLLRTESYILLSKVYRVASSLVAA